MVSITDKFGKGSIDSDHAIATTVKTARTAGATVLEAYDVSKFADDTPVFYVTYKKVTDPVTSEVSVVDLVSYKALVNAGANTLTNIETAPGYTDLGNDEDDFIECIPTSYWVNSLINGIFVGINPDGSFKTNSVNTAAIQDDAVTTPKIDDGAVTPAKRSGGFYIGTIAGATLGTTGNKAITGIGFAPKLVKFYMLQTTGLNVNVIYGLGSMTAAGQFAIAATGDGSNRSRYSSTSNCMAGMSSGSATPFLLASRTSLDADGFTINVATASSAFDWAYEAYA